MIVCALLLGVGCALQAGRPPGRPTILIGPDNRALISDFSDVEAVAASSWFVYAATLHGLLIFDRALNRFRPPVTALDGYPAGRVRRAIADHTGNAVWLDLGTASGYVRYDVGGRVFTIGSLPSTEFDATLTVQGALARAPVADAMRAAILSDSRLRTHQFTAAAGTPDRPEIFFGTNGLGLVRVDKTTGEWDVLNYGLVTSAVGAVAIGSGGVWAAGNVLAGASEQRRGLSWVASDLSSTRTSEGPGAALGFSFLNSRRLVAIGEELWLATDQGVLRINSSTFSSRFFDLPDATCLARRSDGVWVGTTRGLARITNDGIIESIEPRGVPVASLLAVGDTLWVGTRDGLGTVLPGAQQITTPPELADRPTLRVTIRALAPLRDTIVMATDRELLWRDAVTREWSSMPLPLALGVPTALAAARTGVWIGGTLGLAHADIATRSLQFHSPIEVPVPVHDVAFDGANLWLATDSGLVRIQ
jgi:ligand-binding sensor domain-containing protein